MFFKVVFILLFFVFLTVLTQIGGVIFLLILPLFKLADKITIRKGQRALLKFLIFSTIYLVISFSLVPTIAKRFGRIPLPIFSSPHIKPLNILTCLLNRHYVRPKLFETLQNVAVKMEEWHPGTVTSYLDANFPFMDQFPLIPHLSHHDGKKLDLAFLYIDGATKEELNNEAPSFIGYGVYEEPYSNELNKPAECEKLGNWQYSIMESCIPQWKKDDIVFDMKRTKSLIGFLSRERAIGKIFIEPHLKARMKLTSNKIRFHGCHSVRHDDHIHIQLK